MGETATDLNHNASFFHGAFFLSSANSSSLHVYLASAVSIFAVVAAAAAPLSLLLVMFKEWLLVWFMVYGCMLYIFGNFLQFESVCTEDKNWSID